MIVRLERKRGHLIVLHVNPFHDQFKKAVLVFDISLTGVPMFPEVLQSAFQIIFGNGGLTPQVPAEVVPASQGSPFCR